jgi:arylsulfatase
MSRKNVVIIIIDALRNKNMSLYGYEKENDKNIKKIAKKGIWFKEHYSPANSTAPSVTSILTGMYPPNHGILHQLPYTKESEIEKIKGVKFWLPSILQEKGFETIAIDWIGQWFKKGFDYYGEGERLDKSEVPFRPAEEITNLALSKINKTEKPFFLFLHYWDTHFPFPTVKHKKIDEESEMYRTLEIIQTNAQKDYMRKRIEGRGLYSIETMKEKYDISIKVIDEQIGRVYDHLEKEGKLDDTILFILGDHGMSLTEHEIYFNPTGLFEDSIKAPFVMHLPGIKGRETSHLVQNIDIVPTILEFLEFSTVEVIDGKSLYPVIKEDREIRDKVITFDGLCEDIQCVRTKTRKLISAKNSFCNLCKSKHHGRLEEYDLEKDPDEKNNIFSEKSDLQEFLMH